MRLSILIVNWNVKDLLRDCLLSIRRETSLPEKEYEIIVVDNASTDNSVEEISRDFPTVKMIANPHNIGFGKANNQMLAHCHGDLLLLLNPDTLILDGAIDKMLDVMAKQAEITILGCRLIFGDGRLQRWTAGRFPNLTAVACHYLFLDKVFKSFGVDASMYLSTDVSYDKEVDWVSGACLMIRREAVREALFNERYFMYGEDLELCYRIKSEGGQIRYTPSATILHFHGQSIKKQSPKVSAEGLLGPRKFYKEIFHPGTLFAFDLVVCLGFLLRFFGYVLAPFSLQARIGRQTSIKFFLIALKVLIRQI